MTVDRRHHHPRLTIGCLLGASLSYRRSKLGKVCTRQGEITRLERDQVPVRNRATVGVRLVVLDEGDSLACGCAYG